MLNSVIRQDVFARLENFNARGVKVTERSDHITSRHIRGPSRPCKGKPSGGSSFVALTGSRNTKHCDRYQQCQEALHMLDEPA
jgi:hypothetical protein